MSYIGNSPITQAFLTDTFSGNGVATAFTLTIAPATSSSILVAVSGVLQEPSTYGVSGTTLTFTGAPPSGTNNISVRYLGIPSTGVTTTAYRTLTEVTATANQTSFTIPNYTVGYLDVYQNGVLLGASDYTATNGVNVVLATGATSGDLLTMESFYVSSVIDAIPQTGGTFSGAVEFAGGIVNGANVTGAAKTSAGLYSTGAYTGTYTDGVVVDYITGEARISAGSNDIVTLYTGGVANTQMASFSNTTTNLASQTGGLIVPTGTTAQRPANAATGTLRYNSTDGNIEYYNGSSWFSINATNTAIYSVDVLIVAGGGGGTQGTGSGGSGGGGLLYGSVTVTPLTTYSLVVGAGGAAATAADTLGSIGTNSTGFAVTALGGGVGSRNGAIGVDGGSGGGAAGATVNSTNRANTAATQGSSGVFTGLGFTGGSTTGSSYYAGSGGGGAGGVGVNQNGSSGSPGGAGGPGYTWLNGTTYAGGGGGGNENNVGASSGGSGGGGQGGAGNALSTSGTANTGGGAGGTGLGGSTQQSPAANGGSGVVIVRYSGAQRGTGGTVTSDGGYTYHTFTSSGTFTA